MLLRLPVRVRSASALALLLASGALIADEALVRELPVTTPFELRCEVRSWTEKEGLPDSEVRALLQQSDGRMLIGTNQGLARFDGTRIENLESDLRDEEGDDSLEITSLLGGAADRVFIGGPGRDLTVLTGGKVGRLETGMRGSTAGVLDLDDTQWFVTGDSQVLRVDARRASGAFENLVRMESRAMPRELRKTGDGRLWGLLATGSLKGGTSFFELRDGQLLPRVLSGESEGSLHFIQTRAGEIRLLGRQGFYTYEGGQWSLVRELAGQSRLRRGIRISSAVEDDFGNLWIGTQSNGLIVWRGEAPLARLDFPGNTLSTRVFDLLRDRDGSIWAATDSGLFQFVRPPFVEWPAPPPIQSAATAAIAQDGGGTLWFTGSEGVFCLPRGRMAAQAPGPQLERPAQIFPTSNGVFVSQWAGPIGQQTIESWNTVAPALGAAEGGRIERMVATEQAIWVVADSQLHRFEGGEWQVDHPNGKTGLVAEPALGVDEAGLVVAGFRDEGLHRRLPSGSWERLGRPEIPGELRGVAFAPLGGVWVRIGSTSLARLANWRWQVFESDDVELPKDFDLVDDGEALWFHGPSGGVLRLERDAVVRNLNGMRGFPIPQIRFGLDEGLPSMESYSFGNSIYRSRGGRIWVATSAGVAALDPHIWEWERQRRNPPAIFLTSTQVDDGPVLMGEENADSVSMPPDATRLRIGFHGMDLSAPDGVRYLHRLVGLDVKWVSTGKVPEVEYRDLPVGEYLFEVKAVNRNGVESPVSASLPVLVLPHWWEPVLNQGAVVLAVVVGAILMLLLRERSLRTRTAAREAFSRRLLSTQEEERSRIAHELHDSLGQEMLVLKGRLEVAAIKHPEAEEVFESLSGDLSETIERARSLSHDLRPPRLERFGLSRALETLADDLQQSAPFEVTTTIEDLEPRLSTDLEIGLFRIAQEAVANTLKHSKARRVSLDLRRRDSLVTLRIEDDGRGFSPEEAGRGGGLGVAGMAERARLLGGEFRCESAAEEGTVIQVTVRAPLSLS